jgi:hypothetical protein
MYVREALVLFALVAHAVSLSPKFVDCQVQKKHGLSPLTGCPPGTIYVSNDPEQKTAKFSSVQKAIESL